MELVGWIGTGVVLAVAIGIAAIWIYLKRKWKPTYTIIQGCKIYCQECSHMKNRKADVREEIGRCINVFGNSSFFEKGRVIEEMRKLSINFKKKPFKTSAGVMANGMCDSGSEFIAVYIPKDGALKSTAIAHEICHFLMEKIDKKFDCGHDYRKYWNLIGD